MTNAFKGIKVVEVGGAAAMPLAGMLMGSMGAEIIHVEPPGEGDLARMMSHRLGAWTQYSEINYIWEHLGRNKKSICLNLKTEDGQAIIHRLCESADVFLNNLRPYEMDKFKLDYESISKLNPQIIYANLTGYGSRGPEKNSGGYDSVAFWARSGVMDLMHDDDTAPNISRSAYGDSITSLSLFGGIMAALFTRERLGVGQKVEVSLYNTAVWVLGLDITGGLITGQNAMRPQRKTMSNPVRNVYPTKDHRWIMLGMTNAQHYWPAFCRAIERPDIESDPRFATFDQRQEHAAELVKIIDDIFLSRTYAEWVEILSRQKVVWSPVCTPLEVIHDEQALANEFFLEWNHPEYGDIRVLNSPIKLSKTPAGIQSKAPKLGEHTEEILKALGYADSKIQEMKEKGIIQ